MKPASLLGMALLCVCFASVWASMHQGSLSGSRFSKQELQSIHESHFVGGQSVDKSVLNLLSSEQWLRKDHTLRKFLAAADLKVQSRVNVQSFGPALSVVRATHYLGGIAVVGLDRVFSFQNGRLDGIEMQSMTTQPSDDESSGLQIVSSFAVSATEAMKVALKQRSSMFSAADLANPESDISRRVPHYTTRLYLLRGNTITPQWIVRVPQLNPLDEWGYQIDATVGEVITKKRVAIKDTASAKVFTLVPSPKLSLTSQTTSVILDDLLDTSAAGKPVSGKWIDVVSCCPYVVTENGVKRCAKPSEETAANLNLFNFTLGTDDFFYGYRKQLNAYYPNRTIFFEGPICAWLPRAQTDASGTFNAYTPVDGAPAGYYEGFSEVQSYYWTETYLQYLRTNIFQDQTWVIGDNIMTNTMPLLIHTNAVLAPYVATYMVIGQKCGSKYCGSSDKVPFRWNLTHLDMSRQQNAFYTPPISQKEYDSLPWAYQGLDVLSPRGSMFMLQADTDSAYDPAVIMHEMQHAVTDKILSASQPISKWDKWGAHMDEGSIGEALSDFFATNAMNVHNIGTYFAPDSARDLSSTEHTFSTLMYEEHSDAMPLSTALYAIGQLAKTTSTDGQGHRAFARLVMAALAGNSQTETMCKLAGRVLDKIASSSEMSSQVKAQAAGIFAQRGMNPPDDCARVTPQSAIGEKTVHVLPDCSDIGTAGFAPGPTQFKFPIDEAANSQALAMQVGFYVGATSGADPMGVYLAGENLLQIGSDWFTAVASSCPIEYRVVGVSSKNGTCGAGDIVHPFGCALSGSGQDRYDLLSNATLSFTSSTGFKIMREDVPYVPMVVQVNLPIRFKGNVYLSVMNNYKGTESVSFIAGAYEMQKVNRIDGDNGAAFLSAPSAVVACIIAAIVALFATA